MSRRRIAAGILAALGLGVVIALVALVALGVVLEGQTRQGVADRIATSLGATATIDRGSLSLVRGALDLEAAPGVVAWALPTSSSRGAASGRRHVTHCVPWRHNTTLDEA